MTIAIGDVLAPTLVDAKGDLIVGSADNAQARLAVGSDGQVLTADSTQATGAKWGAQGTPGDGTVSVAKTGTGTSGLAAESISVYRNAAYNLAANSVDTVLPFDTESFDVSGRHDTASNIGRYTPQIAGYYFVDAFITMNVNMAAAKFLIVNLRKNGTIVKVLAYMETTAVASPRTGGSTLIQMNGSTDYLEISYQMSDTVVRAVAPGSSLTYFDAFLIGKS